MINTLVPMPPEPEPNDRLAAFGNQLVDTHVRLREELARLRADFGSFVAGDGMRVPDLLTHCLTFCSVLTVHHSGEDDGAFPVLAARYPDLRPVLDELGRDHEAIAGVLTRLAELLGGLGAEPGDDPAATRNVRTELDGLAALLETHLVYEEKKIVALLNLLRPRPGTAEADDLARATTLVGLDGRD
jgi:hypothetical protein